MPSRAAARERYSFATLDEVLEMPDLLAVQKDSFDWFMRDGMREVFKDLSPIKMRTVRCNSSSSLIPMIAS